MSNIWVSTDWHLFSRDNDTRHPFRSRRNLGKLSDNFAQDIQEDDTLIFLGDLCDPDASDIRVLAGIVQSIPCRKIMCRGNHDTQDDEYYLEVGFDIVCDILKIHNLIFSHKPVKVAPDEFNIHGHLHTEKMSGLSYQHINAYATNWNPDDKPVLLDDLIASATVQKIDIPKRDEVFLQKKFEQYTSLESDHYTNIIDLSEEFPLYPVDESSNKIRSTTLSQIYDFNVWLDHNFQYGLIINGKWDPNRNTTSEDWDKYQIVQSPKEIERSKVGVCWDYVSYEAWYFTKNFPDVSYKTYYLQFFDNKDDPTHTILTFTLNGKHYLFENSFRDYAGIYEAKSEDDIINFVLKIMSDHKGDMLKRCGYDVWEYNALDNTLFGMHCQEYMTYVMDNGKCKNHHYAPPKSAVKKLDLSTIDESSDFLDEILFPDIESTKYWLADDGKFRKKADKAEGEQKDTAGIAIDESILTESFGKKTLYHGTHVNVKTLEPMAIDFGNTFQKPGWSTFFFDNENLAEKWAVSMTLRKHRKTNPNSPRVHVYTVKTDANNILLMSTQEDMAVYDEYLGKTPVYCYVYTCTVPVSDIGIGNDSTHNEYTVRRSVKPDKVRKIRITPELLRSMVTVMTRDEIVKLRDANKNNMRGPLSIFMERDFYWNKAHNPDDVDKIFNAALTGELKPGDDIEEYIRKNNLKIETVPLKDRLKPFKPFYESAGFPKDPYYYVCTENCDDDLLPCGRPVYRDVPSAAFNWAFDSRMGDNGLGEYWVHVIDPGNYKMISSPEFFGAFWCMDELPMATVGKVSIWERDDGEKFMSWLFKYNDDGVAIKTDSDGNLLNVPYQTPTSETAILHEMAYEDSADFMLRKLGKYCKDFNSQQKYFDHIKKVWKKDGIEEEPPKLKPALKSSSDYQLYFEFVDIDTSNEAGLTKIAAYWDIVKHMSDAVARDPEVKNHSYIVKLSPTAEDSVGLYVDLKGMNAFSVDDDILTWPEVTAVNVTTEEVKLSDGPRTDTSIIFHNDKHKEVGKAEICGSNYLNYINVRPRYRGKKYGNSIMRYIMKNYDITELCVTTDNEPMIAISKRFGFKEVGRFADYRTTVLNMKKSGKAVDEAATGVLPKVTATVEDRENPNDHLSSRGVKLTFFDTHGNNVGEASISSVDTPTGFLYDVEVFEKCRGKGYGNAIMQYVLDHYKVTELTVEKGNTIAMSLYKKFGFSKKMDFKENGKDMIDMQRGLASSSMNENFIGSVPDLEWYRDEWKPDGKNFLFICGLSGGGKTTTAAEIAKKVKCEIIHLDDLAQAAFVGKMANPNYTKRMSPTMQLYWNSTTDHIRMYRWGDQRIGLETVKFMEWMIKNHEADGKLYIIEGCEIMYLDPDYLIHQPLIIKGTSAIRTTFWRFKRTYGQHREKGESALKAFEHCMMQIMRIYKNGAMIAAENGLMAFKSVLQAARDYEAVIHDESMSEAVAEMHPMEREEGTSVASKYGLRDVGNTHDAEDEDKAYEEKRKAQQKKREREKELDRKYKERLKNLKKGRNTQKRNRFIKKVKSHLPGVKNEDVDGVDVSDATWLDVSITDEYDSYRGHARRPFDGPDKYRDIAVDESSYKFVLEDKVQFFDRIDEAATKDNKLYPVYVMIMHTGTSLSTAIKTVLNSEFSHSSISFDSSMTNMYSFGRKADDNPFNGGFKKENIHSQFFKDREVHYALYVVPCTKTQIDMMQKRLSYFVQNASKFTYDFTGLIKSYFKISDNPEYRWFCTRFVADILNAGKPNDPYIKDPFLVRPDDFKDMNFAIYVTSGYLSDYKKKTVDEITAKILRQKKLEKVTVVEESAKVLDLYPDNPWERLILDYQFTKMDENAVDSFIQYLSSYKLRFDKDGNVVITRREFDQLDSHFRNSLRMIKAYEKAGNLQGVKDELYKINYMIELINKYYLSPDVKNLRPNAKDVRKDMLDLRSVMMNVFQQHLKYVTVRDQRWNFQAGYDTSKYGKSIEIPQKLITAVGKTVITALS